MNQVNLHQQKAVEGSRRKEKRCDEWHNVLSVEKASRNMVGVSERRAQLTQYRQ